MPFYNLNLDKNFVKYCRKLKENYAGLIKNEKRTERGLLMTFLNLLFQLIQREYLLNDWKIYNLSPLSKPKERVNFKT